MACNDERCKSPLDESGAAMNNAGRCSVPGHWTQLSAYPSSISSHSLFYYNTPIFMYHHASPLPLCPQFVFVPHFPVIHFIYSLRLLPRLIASSLLPATFFFRLPSLFLCESIKKLFTVIFLLLLLLLPPPTVWARVSECSADWLSATAAAAASIFPHEVP